MAETFGQLTARLALDRTEAVKSFRAFVELVAKERLRVPLLIDARQAAAELDAFLDRVREAANTAPPVTIPVAFDGPLPEPEERPLPASLPEILSDGEEAILALVRALDLLSGAEVRGEERLASFERSLAVATAAVHALDGAMRVFGEPGAGAFPGEAAAPSAESPKETASPAALRDRRAALRAEMEIELTLNDEKLRAEEFNKEEHEAAAVEIRRRYAAQVIALDRQHAGARMALLEDEAENVEAMQERELDALRDAHVAGLIDEEDAQAKKQEIRRRYSREHVEMAQRELAAIAGFTGESLALIGDLYRVRSGNAVLGIEAEKRTRLAAIDAEREGENVSHARRTKLARDRRRIEEEFARRSGEERRKQAEAEKAFALLGIAVETARNIVEAFPNPFLMAAAATLGTLQAAVVASQKIPEYRKGGLTGSGPSDEPAGIVHKGEMVFESEITRPNEPELVTLRRVLQHGVRLRDILAGAAETTGSAPDGYRRGGIVLSGTGDASAGAARSLSFRFPENSVLAREIFNGGLPAVQVEGMSTAELVKEFQRARKSIDELRGDVQNIQAEQQVVFQGIFEQETFFTYLKRTFPDFEEYRRSKERPGGKGAA